MPTTSTEDTIIGSRPDRSEIELYLDSVNDAADGSDTEVTVVERCRSTFRQLGQRLSSFDLSRQIYG
jgi:hypothetical protein